MFHLLDIKKHEGGISFEQVIDIKEHLMARSDDIIDVDPVKVVGNISFDSGLYLLNYDLSYHLVLPSSRSMEPVSYQHQLFISEVFIEEKDAIAKKDLIDDDLVLVLEGDTINLVESIVDNILLAIPLRILTEEELQNEELPSGNSWSVMTEEQYQALQEEKKAENNPFSALNGLFED
ncbi:YceD family protein [Streptococcus saliviloxodontae]|uniref:DUF177 domain-containing protein n=1 Tax=Streptococcus saliviloxodontae TaxID=1349416 RepID=A0ABS2PKX5_9STRE|nr:DUF177 domain-containing protein [Streptococcus saliviloxodontae]MBM7635458.1 uncharacterized protein [Streptococcus saliviloxodontae]